MSVSTDEQVGIVRRALEVYRWSGAVVTARDALAALAVVEAEHAQQQERITELEKLVFDADTMLTDVRFALMQANNEHDPGEFAAVLYMAASNALNAGFSCDVVDELRALGRAAVLSGGGEAAPDSMQRLSESLLPARRLRLMRRERDRAARAWGYAREPIL